MTRRLAIPAVLTLALILVACGETVQSQPASSAEASESAAASVDVTPAPPPAEGRLALVQERDQLICGVNGSLPGFSFLDENGEMSGFDADYCRAVAAAVLGDPTKVEFRTLNTDQRGPALQTGEIDVLIRNTTWTVTRDTEWGLFAPTTFYDGQGMMVPADSGIETLDDLDTATICVQSGTTTEQNLADQFRALGIDFTPQVFPDIDPTYEAYEGGRCDAITSDKSQLVARRTAFEDPDGHVILDVTMSKEPLGPVVPIGDDTWYNVVKWVVFATIQAEESEITSDNVTEMVDSDDPVVARLLGSEDELGIKLGLENDWVVDVITAVGNYAEIYERNLGPGTPFELPRGVNQLWTDDGLLYAPPYR